MKKLVLLPVLFLLFSCSNSLFAQSGPEWMDKYDRNLLTDIGIEYKPSKEFAGKLDMECFDLYPELQELFTCTSRHLYSTDGHCWTIISFTSLMSRQDWIDVRKGLKPFDLSSLRINYIKRDMQFSYGKNAAENWPYYVKYYNRKDARDKFNADAVIVYPLILPREIQHAGVTYKYCQVISLQRNDSGSLILYCFYDDQGAKKLKQYMKALGKMFRYKAGPIGDYLDTEENEDEDDNEVIIPYYAERLAYRKKYQNENKTGALLWKISGNGLESVSYILGTNHIRPSAYVDEIPEAMNAFKQCDQLIVETAVTYQEQGNIQKQLLTAMTLPPDSNYRQLYSKKEYEEMMPLFTFLGDESQRMKPAFIKNQVVMPLLDEKVNPKDMMDISLVERALAAQKPVIGLETVEEQINYISNYASLQRQAEELLCVCRNLNKVVEAENKSNSYYNYGAANLKFIANRYIPCESVEWKNLNLQRNKRWLPELIRLMKEKSSFIAVGAAHIAGKGSLLELLEQEGFIVESAYLFGF